MFTNADLQKAAWSSTWADRPNAKASGRGALIHVTDVGVNGGSFWRSTGSTWVPAGPIVLAQSNLPMLVPALVTGSAGTYAKSGTTITVTSAGHTIPATTYNGGSVYLSLSGGTETSGWFTNFSRTGTGTFTCTSTTSGTDSGTAATNIAETTVTPLTTTIPGGVMGANGKLAFHVIGSNGDTANDKTLKVKFGTAVVAQRVTTNGSGAETNFEEEHWIANRGNVAKQVNYAGTLVGGAGIGATALTYSTVDTAADVSLTATITVATADEFMALESFSAVLYPA